MSNFKTERINIYLKESDKARLADMRVRIVYDAPAQEPCDHEDLVFEKAKSKDDIPADALMTWKFNCSETPMYFFTTAERCKKLVSEDPSYWTQEKLKWFAEQEHKLYQDWYDGHVYGYVVEKWDSKRREWTVTSSLYGMYGAKDLFDNLAAETDGDSIPVCIDTEEMKYDFDHVEMRPNEFS